MPHWEGMCLKVRGLLHTARGDEEAARNDLDAATEIFERLESRLELARTLVLRSTTRISRAPAISSKLRAPSTSTDLFVVRASRPHISLLSRPTGTVCGRGPPYNKLPTQRN